MSATPAEAGDELRERLERYVGRPMGPPAIAPDPVNVPMIRHWVDALDDRNPVYLDQEVAARSRYLDAVARTEPGFVRDRFLATYAAFGAQRNTRLIGLWVRLLRRDSKPGYLKHMPRTWAYLGRNLAHPDLAGLRTWYEHHFPPGIRDQPIAA